ncbi:6-hydroxymethylpterin diphosphokinase MptE-like protein [Richelia sinica]|uniref:6-hydroxymethylpterin diphosphokinase MptE-like protein n=1 Tax=Richelia sinica TaxID=1357545 RepID=UPI0018EF41C1|nr:6-hydroxymethylpterin diphosphokinase MptE-like protein [Richelia sinica]
MKNWQNKYADHKAVILCNGPSLLKSDLSLLDNVFTFGLNKINLLFAKSSFRTSCIVAVNRFVIEQNADFYNQTDIPLFLDSNAIKCVKPRSNISFLHSSPQPKFAMDCSMSIFQGYTVTFVAMQLAFHMGFTKVALIGCDHNFAVKGPANMTVVAGNKDDSHFDPNYFAGGMKWQLPDLLRSEVFYALARDVFEAHGRMIFNATEGGNLNILPRISLQEFINS